MRLNTPVYVEHAVNSSVCIEKLKNLCILSAGNLKHCHRPPLHALQIECITCCLCCVF